jgi:DNA processing protein
VSGGAGLRPGGEARPATGDEVRPAPSVEVRPVPSDEVRHARVGLAHLAEPGSRDLGEFTRRHGPVEALARLRRGDAPPKLMAIVAPRLARDDPHQRAESALVQAEQLGARVVIPEDDEYPTALEDLVHISQDCRDPSRRDTYPPQCLWVRGGWDLAAACRRSVAVVGARACTAYGNHVAQELGYGLAERGWSVVSGGAFGIDSAAHRGALAASGCTIAVLACGIEQAYPLSNAALFDRIGEAGLLISEWPPDSNPYQYRFLIRNRVIAAMAQGTLVVEAQLRSGARHTLNRAEDLSRVRMAVPGPVTSAASAGCHEEIRKEAVLVTNVNQVIEAVARIGEGLAPEVRSAATARDALTRMQSRVLDGVRRRRVLTAEEIAAAVGVAERDARRALPLLEAAGFVVAVGAGYRSASPR